LKEWRLVEWGDLSSDSLAFCLGSATLWETVLAAVFGFVGGFNSGEIGALILRNNGEACFKQSF